VHFPAPTVGPAGEPAFAPGDLVRVPILEATANYNLGGDAEVVRRTAAGRAAGAAMARGEDHGMPASAAPTPGATGLQLPVLASTPAGR
jgi:hypothetical protein